MDVMVLVVGVVLGMFAMIAASLFVMDILSRQHDTPASEILDAYERGQNRGIVMGARMAERLGAGGSVTTIVQRRHGMEVRRG